MQAVLRNQQFTHAMIVETGRKYFTVKNIINGSPNITPTTGIRVLNHTVVECSQAGINQLIISELFLMKKDYMLEIRNLYLISYVKIKKIP